MSESAVTVEQLDQNVAALLESSKDQNLINWDNVQKSQQQLLKGFEVRCVEGGVLAASSCAR